ncbi:predicted protein [Sclerotinia sclerotiorum 1980 UF-70]|uniref:Uncharacterized protein n=1 Tax=Sclerotinia sclerotiorum (strain ATCC 18683 / 1980 / Ss-1) TaxID=665079 RepID=A7F6A1_SCLS1|nr:predicted protein [Sclerotinia sclerotiorum 1980 UF-70]EDN98272.1 predicted protein [Sclerotinia sclerotiorum 1980 UF-70]
MPSLLQAGFVVLCHRRRGGKRGEYFLLLNIQNGRLRPGVSSYKILSEFMVLDQ